MKREHQLPLIYHPTNVLFLDDEAAFLSMVTGSLDDRIAYITMTEPSMAFEHLKQQCYHLDTFSSLLTCHNFEQVNDSESIETFDVDFSKLIVELNNSGRFQKITLVFVDQVMAKMKGLDFCRQVKEANFPVKLVLLTGNTEQEEVINAFNEGLIDAYLPKNDPNLSEKINEQTLHFCSEQFIELGQQLLGFVSPLMKPLYEKGFLGFFNGLLKKFDCCEFYLLDSSGSFLLLDDQGKGRLLLMYQESDFNHYYDIAEDDGASTSVLQLIKDKKKMPVKNLYDKCLSLQGKEWLEVMKDCHQVAGEELYYTLVEEPAVNAFGFERYLDEIWLKDS